MILLTISENYVGPIAGILITFGVAYVLQKFGIEKASKIVYGVGTILVIAFIIKSCTG
jgi:hypothetical protein